MLLLSIYRDLSFDATVDDIKSALLQFGKIIFVAIVKGK
jgi:hypothetical protein